MVRLLFALTFFLVASDYLLAQEKKEVYLFSFFQGNGEDGLHLAYSYDGMKWKALRNNQSFLTPTAGKDKLMRDPCVIQGTDGMFHMVWTVSWNERGIGYASSPDLINWSEQKYIPVMEHEPEALNCWAPELYFDEASKRYVIIWSTTIPGRFPETDRAGDSKYNHRMYYTTTRDFETFDKTALFYDKGFNVIDGTLVKENEKYVIFLKDETRHPAEKNIRVATGETVTGPFSKASEPITGDYWAEGPTAVKIDNYWVVYFDKYTEHEMGAVRSVDLVNWEDISDEVVFPKGTRHGTVFSVPLQILERLQ